jgi:glycosyltransferase involved in cell wall biosynthesis
VLGYVDEPKLAALYAHAKFLAMPSLYEGFGLPLVEAMMHGTPVLTANNSSMPEVAGDAGLLVDAQDINSIRDGLMNLLSDEVLRNKLGNNAIIQAIKFNWDDSARQLVSAFNDVISRRKSLS